jgi:hypothetical protein
MAPDDPICNTDSHPRCVIERIGWMMVAEEHDGYPGGDCSLIPWFRARDPLARAAVACQSVDHRSHRARCSR